MRRWACATVLALSAPALPHRLDEYLQLASISIERGHVRTTVFLTPGVAVAKRVLALIDANGDGVLSEKEKRAYAARFARDLSLSIDGVLRPLRIVSLKFPTVASMRQGSGWIQIVLDAPSPTTRASHALRFENRHQRPIAAYLVECLVPDDASLRVGAQSRSHDQARYELRYVQA